MEYVFVLVVAVVCIIVLGLILDLSLDFNNETGDLILWYGGIDNRRFIVLIENLF